MFVFAHVFAGTLIGFGFWHLTGDRRVFPAAVFGALLPDLIDKSLSLLIPGYLRILAGPLDIPCSSLQRS